MRYDKKVFLFRLNSVKNHAAVNLKIWKTWSLNRWFTELSRKNIQGLGNHASAMNKHLIETHLDALNFFLKRGISICGSELDFHLTFKFVKGWFLWGSHAVDARLQNPEIIIQYYKYDIGFESNISRELNIDKTNKTFGSIFQGVRED